VSEHLFHTAVVPHGRWIPLHQ
ncbi:hypothetical protein AZZ66_004668, partial [Escherichia coli]